MDQTTTDPKSRRDFMRLATTVAASLAVGGPPLLASAGVATQVRAWSTTKDSRFQSIEAPQWQPWSGVSSMGISLHAEQRLQTILGFGGAFTDASCYLLSQLGPQKRQTLLSELYGPTGLRLSIGRTAIGSSDYSRTAYSYDDSPAPDPELKKFSIEHDRAYVLPTLIDAAKINPDLFLFASPWSPPGWMKSGGSLLGGSMRARYFDPYAQYFLKYLKAYSAAGVKIRAITIQNEVDTDQDGRMPQALWGQEYEADFIKDHLGPTLAHVSPDTKIWILDHNYNLWGRVVDELSDPAVYKYVDGVAWHGYAGLPDAMTRVHDMFPRKHAYWTEGGPDFTQPDYATDWSKWSETFSGILHNWARCIVGWNLVLDEKGGPNIGPFNCGGIVTLHSKTQHLIRSGQYWAFAHYSKVMQRGASILGSSGELPGISHVAAENPDGSRVLVLTNRGAAQRVQCTLGAEALKLEMPSDSITSLVW